MLATAFSEHTTPMVIHRRQWGQIALLVALAGHVAVAVKAQSQDTINATLSANQRSVEMRVEALERADLPARMRVVEDATTEMKWLTRGVTLAIAGQLVLKIMENRKRA